MKYRILLTEETGVGMQHLTALPIWNEYGFEITGRAVSAASAISALTRNEFDALVCMHRPSETTTVEILSRLHQKRMEVPVIVISNTDDSACMRQCFLNGAVDFLVEPLEDRDVRSALQRMAKLLEHRVMNAEYRAALEASIRSLQEKQVSDAITEKIREFLLSTQDTTVTTEAAAEYFGFNRDYFTRYFKSKTGMTFSEFHKGFKIEYAKLLLSGGHFRVQEVSDILGFSTADYFTRIFKKRTGKTPSEFRNL